MNRLLTIAAVAGLTCLLVGCSQTSPGQSAAPQTRPAQGAERVNLGLADNGKTLQLAPGAVVQITLDSNVTTGYSWKLAKLDTAAVEQTKQEYIAPKTERVGAGGQEVWTFTARSAGRTPLRLEYIRPWEEKVAPAKVFEITLVVR
jgi:inhibitor of cysteine peptidase